MKKILITGGAGFIGANLVRRLVAEGGFQVFIIEKKGTSLWRLKDVVGKVAVHFVDLEDEKHLYKIITSIKPNVVFHLAGYGAYPAFQHDVMEMARTNINGTLNLVNAVKNIPITTFINIGSSSEYKEKKSAIAEDDATDPANLYAVTKLATVLLLKKMAEEYNLPIINVRPFNVYGQYGNSQGFVHYAILGALRNEKIELSSPSNVRDFIFIEDLVDLFLRMMKITKKYRGEIFNAGSSHQYSIVEALRVIEKILGRKIQVSYKKKGNYYREAKSFRADIKKAKKAFGWKPLYTIDVGFEKTARWFLENQALYAHGK